MEGLYKDATHPNSEGHQIIAQKVYDYLKEIRLLRRFGLDRDDAAAVNR